MAAGRVGLPCAASPAACPRPAAAVPTRLPAVRRAPLPLPQAPRSWRPAAAASLLPEPAAWPCGSKSAPGWRWRLWSRGGRLRRPARRGPSADARPAAAGGRLCAMRCVSRPPGRERQPAHLCRAQRQHLLGASASCVGQQQCIPASNNRERQRLGENVPVGAALGAVSYGPPCSDQAALPRASIQLCLNQLVWQLQASAAAGSSPIPPSHPPQETLRSSSTWPCWPR